MKNNKSKCCCGSNTNQFSQLDEILTKYQEDKAELNPVMHDTQNA